MFDRVGGLDATLDWPNVLGTGEQQRLAFARMLLVKPRIVFLDEATTAMDREIEEELYSLLPSVVERYVSTGSPTDLKGCHEHILNCMGMEHGVTNNLPTTLYHIGSERCSILCCKWD